MDKLHIKIYRKIKEDGVKNCDLNKAESIVKSYYKLCDKYLKKYGNVNCNYTRYNGLSKEYRQKIKQADALHHIEQIWYDDDLNPKLGTAWLYKANYPKDEISQQRNEHYNFVMTHYALYQEPEYLVWCSKSEHKLLHRLINEYRELCKGGGVN